MSEEMIEKVGRAILREVVRHEPNAVERYGRAAIAAYNPNERLREALEEAREALVLAAAIPPMDRQNQDAVVQLGERIGYGALMSTASVAWRAALGDLVGSEFCAGPCRATAEKAIAAIDSALSPLPQGE